MRVRREGTSRRATGPRGGRIPRPSERPARRVRIGRRTSGTGGVGLPIGLGRAGAVGGLIVVLVIAFLALRDGGSVLDGETSSANDDVIGVRTSLVEQDRTTRRDLTSEERSELDGFVADAIDDLVLFWDDAFPAIYGSPFQQLADVFPYSPSGGASISCGGALRPEQLSANAIYCSDGDYVTWDADFLFPNFYANFGKAAVGVVLAHEWGHAVQFRADLDAAPIVRELQADCFAGAWIQRGVDGSGAFELDATDVDAAIAGFLLLRDPPGAPISGQQAHGSAFDRMNAFREGVESGEAHCATYAEQGPRIVDLVLQRSELEGGNLSYDAAVDAVLADLDVYWNRAFQQLGFTTTPASQQFSVSSSCPDVSADEALVYCSERSQIEWNSESLQELHRVTGDFATGLLIARLYGEALVVEAEVSDELGLVADCLAGVWAGDVAYTSTRPFELSAGDLDEGMAALLNDPDGSGAVTFDRIAAFETGFFEGDQGTLDGLELCRG